MDVELAEEAEVEVEVDVEVGVEAELDTRSSDLSTWTRVLRMPLVPRHRCKELIDNTMLE